MTLKLQTLINQLFGRKTHKSLKAHDVQGSRQYINQHWKKLERKHPRDNETLISLPNPYIAPAYEKEHPFDFNEMYYWDSYFIIQGLLSEKNKKLVLGMLDNLLSMQIRFGLIPNASRTYLLGRSQPPFLTSIIMDIYNAYGMDKKWLKEKMSVAESEYKTVWMGDSKPHWRRVYKGLSRYFDVNMINDLVEAESGWDMTPRFERKALDYLPVDLNALLYKYEMDFAKAADINHQTEKANSWRKVAEKRKKIMNELMWNNSKKFFYDYNFVKQTKGTIASLAGYFPMWAGMVDKKQAKYLVQNLKKFEQTGGLATTEPQNLNFSSIVDRVPTQWAYPNGWAPLHFIVVFGLLEYGYKEEARRISVKWLKTNLYWFRENGIFLEKYNVVDPTRPPIKGLYPSQAGFGWTNAVFERLCKEFID